jgi:hypothetical protein
MNDEWKRIWEKRQWHNSEYCLRHFLEDQKGRKIPVDWVSFPTEVRAQCLLNTSTHHFRYANHS